MTGEEPIGPHTETTFTVHVKAKVDAVIEATFRIPIAHVAAFHEVEESAVTEAMVNSYIEDGDSEAVEFDEGAFDLYTVEDWRKITSQVHATNVVRITPPGWVPMWQEEHAHTDRANRDMCRAGRCYVNTIVPQPESS